MESITKLISTASKMSQEEKNTVLMECLGHLMAKGKHPANLSDKIISGDYEGFRKLYDEADKLYDEADKLVMELLSGFKIEIDKTKPKWSGYIDVESNYQSDNYYVTSYQKNFNDALSEILSEYSHKKLRGIKLKRTE